ncbi:MAG: DUF4142 domain-containing protein [Myxococcota bacterium]
MSAIKTACLVGLLSLVTPAGAHASPVGPPGETTSDDEMSAFNDVKWDDHQITLVLFELAGAEARASEIALLRTNNPQVTILAEKLLAEGAGGARKMVFFNRYVVDVAADDGEDPFLFQIQLGRHIGRGAERLWRASDENFDLMYAESMVRLQRVVVALLDNVLLGTVENPKLRQELENARFKAQSTLNEAEKLHAVLKGRAPSEEPAP